MNTANRKFIDIFNYVLLGILLIVTSYMTFLLISSNFLHIKYVKYSFIFLIVLIVALLVLVILKKLKIFSMISLLLSIGIVVFSTLQIKTALNLFDKLNESTTFSESTMVVAVLKNGNIRSIKELNGKNVTYSDIDGKNVRSLSSELKEKENVEFNAQSSFSYPEVYEKLEKKQAEGIVINKSFYDLINSVYPNFTDNIDIIYEYTVKNEVKKIDVKTNTEVKKTKGNTFNVYISGIDTYGSISTVSRSDVNIIMTVNEDTNKILLTTTPRDSYVNIVGQGDGAYDKLTHAGLFGVETSMATLEKLYDINIEYYMRVNFTSFLNIIDLLGGIEVDNPVEFTTEFGVNFPAGKIYLNSKKALIFVRERYSLQYGDGDRGRNQERVIAAIIKKLSSKEVLSNYSSIINEISSSIQTNMPMNKIVSMAGERLNSGSNFKVESQSLTGRGRNDLKSYLMPTYRLYMLEIDSNSLNTVKENIYNTENGK